MKCPRNRRCRKCQDIDSFRQALNFFFLLDTEALFLIDDEQAEIFPNDLLLIKYRMRADENIDLTQSKFFQRCLLLLCCAKTADNIDGRFKILKTCRKGLIVLLGKNCCRHQDSNLLAVQCRFICCADSNFCFTKTDVAAKKTLHRLFAFHICLNFSNCPKLVVGFLIRKGFFKVMLTAVVRRESVTSGILSLRIDRNKFLCDIFNRFAHARLRLDPLRTAHAMKTRRITFRTNVFLQ